MAVAPVASPFNTGGWSASVIHDALTPSFQESSNQNVPKAIRTFYLYLLIWLVQTGLIVWAGYARLRRSKIQLAYSQKSGWRGLDPGLYAGSLLFLINSLAGMSWPWWEK